MIVDPVDTLVCMLVAGGIVVSLVYLLGITRKVPAADAAMPSDALSIDAPLPPLEALQSILDYAHASGHIVEQIDPEAGSVTLGRDMGVRHDAYWLLVRVEGTSTGDARVRIAIVSKVGQFRFLMRPLLDQAARDIWSRMEMSRAPADAAADSSAPATG